MKSRALPLLGAGAAGFLVAGLLFGAALSRPASAQFKQGSPGTPPLPLGNLTAPTAPAPAPPQPIAIQALDTTHFVVATREPRLVLQIGREGPVQSMLCTVVSHYTVAGDRLVPLEHVRVPTGYRVVTLAE